MIVHRLFKFRLDKDIRIRVELIFSKRFRIKTFHLLVFGKYCNMKERDVFGLSKGWIRSFKGLDPVFQRVKSDLLKG